MDLKVDCILTEEWKQFRDRETVWVTETFVKERVNMGLCEQEEKREWSPMARVNTYLSKHK